MKKEAMDLVYKESFNKEIEKIAAGWGDGSSLLSSAMNLADEHLRNFQSNPNRDKILNTIKANPTVQGIMNRTKTNEAGPVRKAFQGLYKNVTQGPIKQEFNKVVNRVAEGVDQGGQAAKAAVVQPLTSRRIRAIRDPKTGRLPSMRIVDEHLSGISGASNKAVRYGQTAGGVAQGGRQLASGGLLNSLKKGVGTAFKVARKVA